ncbi:MULTISPECIES: hypothetical protein [unclassified Bradyrhizobium]|uniref:hypothetical protein n=1 Tax=Bradyrhizobium TaxID=374 RepID=UPI0028E4B9F0|nr:MULTISPECIES: hypothetical protein [unclassified Bradyrhizobium]
MRVPVFLVAGVTSVSLAFSTNALADDALQMFDGVWVSISPPGPHIVFNKIGQTREASLPNLGQASITSSRGESGSNYQIAGAGFTCYYLILTTNAQAKMVWELKSGSSPCFANAVFERADSENEKANSSARPATAMAPAALQAPNAALAPSPTQPNPPSEGGRRCGYYAIAYCSEDLSVARGISGALQAQLIDTNARNYYPNFRAGWYCVGVGPLNRDTAQSAAQGYKQRGYPTAYFKNSC